MTKNSYEASDKSKSLPNMIAGGKIFLTDSPQQTKRLEKDDTQEKKDAIFDAAFKCAMNEAGVP